MGLISLNAYSQDQSGSVSGSQVTASSQAREDTDFQFTLFAAKPAFSGRIGTLYERFYGSTEFYPYITGTKNYWQGTYGAIGLTMGLGYFSDSGYALRRKNGVSRDTAAKDLNPSDLEKDANGPIALVMVPLRVGGAYHFGLGRHEMFSFDVLAGLEYAMIEETRSVSSDSSASEAKNTSSSSSGEAQSATSAPITRVNQKSVTAIAAGAAFNILLNGLDPTVAFAMERTLGFSRVYLTLLFDTVMPLGASGMSSQRNQLGIGFSFAGGNSSK